MSHMTQQVNQSINQWSTGFNHAIGTNQSINQSIEQTISKDTLMWKKLAAGQAVAQIPNKMASLI